MKTLLNQYVFGAFLMAFLIIGCKEKITDEAIQNINGYWEIEKVEHPTNGEKQYTKNTNVDYFEYKNGKGFRQKVTQVMDGSFETNSVQEELQIIDSLDTKFMKYTTPYNHWVEEIIRINPNELVVKNEQEIYYFYKRYQPLKF